MSEPHSRASNLSAFFAESKNGWVEDGKSSPSPGGFYIWRSYIFNTLENQNS